MSFLLDALRKSEAQRRLGEVPTLSAATSYTTSQRHHSRKWLLLVVAGLAVGLTAFMTWRELLSPPVAPEPVALVVPDDPVSETLDVEPAGVPERRDEPMVDPPVSEPAEIDMDDPSARAAEAARLRRQARVEQRAAEPQPGSDAEAVTESPTDKATATVGTSLPEPEPEPAQTVKSDRREYVNQWELPASVRSDLPELNVMAHIYSEDPESRFILMNGRRFVEGDSLADGVTLAEIRREGAVVDFREYRFLVE